MEKGLRTSGIGIAANVLLAVIKVTAGLVGNSNALVADGIESTADVVSSIIVWSGLRISARPPDDDHPYGHGKAESIAGVLVAAAICLAALIIGARCIHEIRTPHLLPAPFTLAVLLVVIVVKEILYRQVIKVGRDLNSTAVRADAWHHRVDAATSIAAFVGIVVALAGGPGWESADDWAAFLACGVIAWNGLQLLKPAVHELMDGGANDDFIQTVRQTAQRVPGVHGVGKCRVRKSGLGWIVDIHIKVSGDLRVTEGHALAHAVEDRLRSLPERIVDVTVHVEPAQTGTPRAPEVPVGTNP